MLGGEGEPSPGGLHVAWKPWRSRGGCRAQDGGAQGYAGDRGVGVLGLDGGQRLDTGQHVVGRAGRS